MREFLKTYTIKLKIVTPVFIGSGSSISKKEYILDKREQKYYIIDPILFLQEIKKRNLLMSYTNFLMNSPDNLATWCDDNRIGADIYKKCIKYALEAKDIDINARSRTGNVNNKEILCFAKNAYGQPYIAGSSLKGAIRTTMLAYAIHKNQEKYTRMESTIRMSLGNIKDSPKRLLSSEIKEIETATFHLLDRNLDRRGDAVNSIMSGVRISDSRPLHLSDIVLCQKTDLTVDGTTNKLNILRECLAPGTEVEFDLTIDATLCKYKHEDILEAIKYTNQLNQNVFYSKFPLQLPLGRNILYLGGGVGFSTKSILNALYMSKEAIRLTSKIMEHSFRNHKHNRDVEMGVSPHMRKCTEYGGKIVDMGVCDVEIFKK